MKCDAAHRKSTREQIPHARTDLRLFDFKLSFQKHQINNNHFNYVGFKLLFQKGTGSLTDISAATGQGYNSFEIFHCDSLSSSVSFN